MSYSTYINQHSYHHADRDKHSYDRGDACTLYLEDQIVNKERRRDLYSSMDGDARRVYHMIPAIIRRRNACT